MAILIPGETNVVQFPIKNTSGGDLEEVQVELVADGASLGGGTSVTGSNVDFVLPQDRQADGCQGRHHLAHLHLPNQGCLRSKQFCSPAPADHLEERRQ